MNSPGQESLFVVPAGSRSDAVYDRSFVNALAESGASGDFRVHDKTVFPSGEMIVAVPLDVGQAATIVLVPCRSPSDALVELLLVADALRRAGVRRIECILQYLPYSRSNRLNRQGLPLGSKVVVSMLEQSPIDTFVVFDLHARELLGYFDKPVIWLTTLDLMSSTIARRPPECVVSPDRGRFDDCVHLSAHRECSVDMLVKVRRDDNSASELVAGARTELDGRSVILFDDEIWSGVTAVHAAESLFEAGAKRIDYMTVYDFTSPGVRTKLLDDVGVSSYTTTNLGLAGDELAGDDRYQRVDAGTIFRQWRGSKG
jgi:ribose-phosphate pyrophosphokinase